METDVISYPESIFIISFEIRLLGASLKYKIPQKYMLHIWKNRFLRVIMPFFRSNLWLGWIRLIGYPTFRCYH